MLRGDAWLSPEDASDALADMIARHAVLNALPPHSIVHAYAVAERLESYQRTRRLLAAAR